MRKADIVRLGVAGVFIVLCAAITVPTAQTFFRSFDRNGKSSVEKCLAKARKAVADKFPERLAFVTLNGFFVRLLGQHLCNGVVKTRPHGMLLSPNGGGAKLKGAARRMKGFSDFCEKNGAAFLYVQLPRKLDTESRMIPPGVAERSNANARKMMRFLKRNGVPHLDLRADFTATPDDVKRNFYMTDHHWRNDAAFAAAGRLVPEIVSRCGVPEEEARKASELLSPGSWTREVYPSCFLGSLGRRTGSLFSGLDDLTVYRPRFGTSMSIRIPSKRVFVKGTFEETNMRRAEEALSGAESFTTDAYSALYVGGIYPQTIHENPQAPIRKRVLLIGDSFARPVEAFLSVAVEYLEAVDPRRTGRAFDLAEHVRRTKPDVVIQMINPSSLRADAMKGPKTGRAVMFEYGLGGKNRRTASPAAGR